MSQILIGCDPEVFVKQDGIFKSAFNLIKGDKKNPQKIRSGAVQVDGMALEFNIDPAATEEEFCFNVVDVFEQMKKMVPQYEIAITPVADFDPAYLKTQPAAALELGCDPDYNAWDGKANERPAGDRPMRTASGHIHIGWTNGASPRDVNHRSDCNLVARNLDFWLGLVSLIYDDDVRRRSMYGKAGAVRYKPYGVEYRTLSNAWLRSDKLMRLVYRNAVKGTQQVMEGVNLFEKYGDIQEIINNSDVKAAMKILEAEKIEVPNV